VLSLRAVRRVLVSAVLGALVIGGCATGAVAAPRLTGVRSCPHQPGFTCATLTVPLDHAGQARGTLRLKVAVQRVGRAPRGVLLFLTGGPGQPGVNFISHLRDTAGSTFAGYRLVMLDQRGTGADPLRCPALQTAVGSSDLTVAPPGTVAACARKLGPRRRFFTTPETVADLESLRVALSARRMTIAGVSYGTFVAERYALTYRRRVARLVLDSVVPQGGIDLVPIASFRATARVLRLACADEHCGYDPAADLHAVVRARRDGPRLLDTITGLSIGAASFAHLLPALHEARAGNYGPLNAVVRDQERLSKTPATDLSQGLHESTLCLDLPRPWDPSASLSQRGATLRRLAGRIGAGALFPFDRGTALGNGFTQNCLQWPPTSPPALSDGNPRASLPRVPVLLLNGNRDLSTPLAWAREEAAKAPDGRLVVVAGVGHSVFLGPKAAAVHGIVKRFLDRERAPDTRLRRSETTRSRVASAVEDARARARSPGPARPLRAPETNLSSVPASGDVECVMCLCSRCA
jgi:pimeloyl-ACP methyl ester carboxylesterase